MTKFTLTLKSKNNNYKNPENIAMGWGIEAFHGHKLNLCPNDPH